jgi:hypothetical protein
MNLSTDIFVLANIPRILAVQSKGFSIGIKLTIPFSSRTLTCSARIIFESGFGNDLTPNIISSIVNLHQPESVFKAFFLILSLRDKFLSV